LGEISSNTKEDNVFTLCLLFFCRDLDRWPFDLKIWSAYLCIASTFVVKIGWNSLHCFWDMVFTRFFWTHRLADSLTDGQTRTLDATKVFCDEGI